MPPLPTFKPDGQKIRQIRRSRGVTVRQLARVISRHEDSLTRIENSSPPTSEVFLAQIARTLGVTVDEITVPDESADEAEPVGSAA